MKKFLLLCTCIFPAVYAMQNVIIPLDLHKAIINKDIGSVRSLLKTLSDEKPDTFQELLTSGSLLKKAQEEEKMQRKSLYTSIIKPLAECAVRTAYGSILLTAGMVLIMQADTIDINRHEARQLQLARMSNSSIALCQNTHHEAPAFIGQIGIMTTIAGAVEIGKATWNLVIRDNRQVDNAQSITEHIQLLASQMRKDE